MKTVLIPGYKDLYGESVLSYDDILKNTSSDTVIMLLISLNAELNTEETYLENQKRVIEVVTFRYTPEQISLLNDAISNYKAMAPDYSGALFSRRYLLSMLLKELKRNNKDGINETDPIHEYNFLLAYLFTVDEVNNKDHALLEVAKKYNFQIMPAMPLIWASNISQYEFNDMSNSAFELFKLLSFCKYSYHNHRLYLKELLNRYGFTNISQFMASFNQVVKSTLTYQPNEILRKLYFIVPREGIEHTHLISQCINNIKDKSEFNIADLRKFPLYKTQKRGFMVIDENMYTKKIYRGPLFELHKETTLRKEMEFEDYKNKVSKDCFEDVLFKGIVSQMLQKETSILHFDSNSENGEPDLYYRYGNDVFLIEFKDYLFPDSIIEGANFGAYKKYINEKFLLSDKGKNKGVSQLSNCINNLLNKKYEFDFGLNEKIDKRERINIHPIICHTDFMFSMPGVNEYLNCLFVKELKEKECTYAGINNITLVNLEVFFDLALRGGDFMKLLDFIKAYYKMIDLMRRKASISLSADDFIPSTASFDELYKIKFRNEMIDNGELTDKFRVNTMTSIIGISQEQINEIL
ncbi:MAG: hypothetical protein JNK27_05365 [Chitinophagaceae bacterium]|nr:hypothetical protein [Chitinophagaceae bacterium]